MDRLCLLAKWHWLYYWQPLNFIPPFLPPLTTVPSKLRLLFALILSCYNQADIKQSHSLQVLKIKFKGLDRYLELDNNYSDGC